VVPRTLAMQHAAVSTAGKALLERYWSAGTAPVWRSSPSTTRSNPKTSGVICAPESGIGVTSTVIGNASHALFPEQPDAVAAAVLRYLKTDAITSA